MKISIGSDHGGYELKKSLIAHLETAGHHVIDKGCFSSEPVDYPDFAETVATSVSRNEAEIGIMIDGAGVGSCMVANKIAGVRAALCNDLYTAKNAREHNDANMLTLGSMVVGKGKAAQIVDVFISASFQGGRHSRRVEKINRLDKTATSVDRSGPALEEVIRNVVESIIHNVSDNAPKTVQPEENASNAPVLISEEYLRNLWKKGIREVKVSPGSIITPLARDFARDHHLNIL